MKFEDCVELELSKLGAKVSKNLIPNPVAKLFTRGRDFHNYNTRNRNNPLVGAHKSSIYNKSFLCKSPSLWNGMSPEIKNCKTIASLSRKIKKNKVGNYL